MTLLDKALERAQQKVEARNFDIRKTLIKFDNVLNDQRHVIFSQRNDAMNSDEIFNYSKGFLNEILDELLKLKLQNLSNPSDSEFKNRLKILMGKSLNEEHFKEIISLKDNEFRTKITNQFNGNRIERTKILGNEQSK